MMLLKVNEEFIEVDVPQIDIGGVQEYKQLISDLSSQASSLKSQIPAVSDALAPTSATTPSLIKRYTGGGGYSIQGGCTDGNNIYFYVKQQDESNAGKFVKLDSSYSEINTVTMPLYHGNDMTYNPVTGYIYVATMYQSGASSRVDVVDPESLTIVEQRYFPHYISAIAYEPTKDLFVGTYGGLPIYIFKINSQGDFEMVRSMNSSESPSYTAGRTSQGITCDSGFIYHVWTTAPYMYLEVFDWLGNYKSTITKTMSYNDSTLGTVNMEVEWIEKTSKNGFLAGAYGYGKGSGSPKYIYTFTTS